MVNAFIKGSLILFPVPSPRHENLKGSIYNQIWNYLKNSSHKVYTDYGIALGSYLPEIKDLRAFQVYFKEKIEKGTEKNTSLIPDIFVVCDYDEKDFNAYGYIKPPKMVVEILSPSTATRDIGDKKDLYEFIGVQEYWVVVDSKNTTVYLLEDGKYKAIEFSIEDTEEEFLDISTFIFPDLKNRLEE
jgi:Uma2 family endonuclease